MPMAWKLKKLMSLKLTLELRKHLANGLRLTVLHDYGSLECFSQCLISRLLWSVYVCTTLLIQIALILMDLLFKGRISLNTLRAHDL